MPSRSVGSAQTIIIQFVFGSLLVAFGFYCVRAISNGSSGLFRLAIGLTVLTGIVLALDRRYWILFAVFTTFGLKIPSLPFSGMELAWLIIVTVHFLRIASHKDVSTKLNGGVLAALPFVVWVLLVFGLNPVGLARYGSNTIGGRFYFQIFMSFLAFAAISSLEFDEQDAKLLFRTIFICCALGALLSVFRHEAHASTEEIDSGASAYFLIPMAHIYMLCCCQWSLSSIFQRPHRFLLFATSAILSIVSGKRQMFGRIVLCPIFRAFATKKEYVLTGVLGLLGALFVFVAVVGDGSFYTLPPGARRALAVAVPSYRTSDLDGGVEDFFRREVRRYAYDLIRDNPWFGRKGFAMNLEQTVWVNFGGTKAVNLYAGHAEAGNWHNLYLAYACDFGIPGFLLAMMLLLYSLRYAYKACRTINTGGYAQACCLFFAFKIFDIAIFGWVSGGAAISTYMLLNHLGLLIATVNGFKSSLVRQAGNPSLSYPIQPLLSEH